VEHRRGRAPQGRPAERDVEPGAGGRGRRRRTRRRAHASPRRADAHAVEPHLDVDLEALAGVLVIADLDLDAEGGAPRQYVARSEGYLAQPDRADDLEAHLAVDAAVAQVVDRAAEGRHVRPLPGVDDHGERARSRDRQVIRDVDGERGVAADVGACEHTLDVDLGRGGDAVEVQEGAVPRRQWAGLDRASIGRDVLVGRGVDVVVREVRDGVRHVDEVQAGVVESRMEVIRARPRREAPGVVEVSDLPGHSRDVSRPRKTMSTTSISASSWVIPAEVRKSSLSICSMAASRISRRIRGLTGLR